MWSLDVVEPITVMIIGNYRGRDRGGASSAGRSYWGSDHPETVGEVPHIEPSLVQWLARSLVLRIKFQDFEADDSLRKLTYSQQAWKIVSNIHGNSEAQLSHIQGLVHKHMSVDELKSIINYILNVVYPIDMKSALLESAGLWKDKNDKFLGQKQPNASFWMQYIGICERF